MARNGRPRPSGIGIKAMELHIPNRYISQSELEKHDGVSAGKYEIGLGQIRMGFCDDREDIYSFCLTATSALMEKYNISPSSIGRLEVGTETLLDKSKSVKSVLMQLFAPSGNTNIEGIDTINACYGGTNALFNAVNWIESSAWDGRDAIVVAGDIAIYERGPARPTGGAGVIAMLVGPNAPLVIEPGRRGSYMQHAYDFYKPKMSSEYPVVDGHYSIECYFRALDSCYEAYSGRTKEIDLDAESDVGSNNTASFHMNVDRSDVDQNGVHQNGVHQNGLHQNGVHLNGAQQNGAHLNDVHQNGVHENGMKANGAEMNGAKENGDVNGSIKEKDNEGKGWSANGETTSISNTPTEFEKFDYMCFHTPSCKLAQKSYARLLYNDYRARPNDKRFEKVPSSILDVDLEKSFGDKAIEKTFMALSGDFYKKRSLQSTLAASMCGNMYTASLYGALVSLISTTPQEELFGKRVAMFSYGSGLASTLFSLRVAGDLRGMRDVLNLQARLDARHHKSPGMYEKALYLREVAYSSGDFRPAGDTADLLKGTYYLTYVDDKFRRFYDIKE